MSEPINNNGELLLPVCIPESEITEILSALDLYRVLRKGGESSIAFDSVVSALEFIDNPQNSPCLPDSGSNVCWAVDTTNSAIRFYPNDPFIDIDLQDRPTIGQWERWEDSLARPPEWIQNLLDIADSASFFDKNIGYFPNDCLVVAPDESANDVTQFFSTLNALKQLDFPYVEIEVSGTGELELHLLKVPFGGSAIVVWDTEFNVWDYLWDLINGGSSPIGNIIQTELEREILTLPPEANEENVIEIDFTEDMDHIVRVYFVPRFDYTALDFLGNGGGIREVSACDGLTLMSPTGESINKQNFKIGEFTRKGFIMSTTEDICAGVICAMETVAQRILLASSSDNVENDVIIGASGNGSGFKTTFDKTGTLSLPEYSTTADEQKNGGAYNQASMFARLFLTVDEQITGGFTDVLIEKALSYTLAGIEVFSFGFLDYRTADSPIVIDIDKLAESIYCKGSFSDGLMDYSFDTNNHDADDLSFILDMASDIPDAILKDWYAIGKTSPLTLYTGYACYREPVQSYVYDLNNPVSLTPESWYGTSATNRKYRVELEVIEQFVDDTGRKFDGIYIEQTNGALDTWTRLRLKAGNGNLAMGTIPSYLGGTGTYILNYQSGGTPIDGSYFYALGTDRPWGTAVSGHIEIRIYDLGAV